MSLARLDVQFEKNGQPCDGWEHVGNFCAKFLHGAFGHRSVTVQDQKFPIIEKVGASVGLIFLFLLTLPLSLPLSLIGIICLSFSKTHQEKSKGLEFQKALTDLNDLSKSIRESLVDDDMINNVRAIRESLQYTRTLEMPTPKWHHLLHDAICRVSDLLTKKGEEVKDEWRLLLEGLQEIEIVYPKSQHGAILDLKVKWDTKDAIQRLDGYVPKIEIEICTKSDLRVYGDIKMMERSSLREDEPNLLSINDMNDSSHHIYVARDVANNSCVVGFLHVIVSDGKAETFHVGRRPAYGACGIMPELYREFSPITSFS